MTTTEEITKKLSKGHSTEIKRALQRERGYKQNKAQLDEKLREHLRQTVQDAGMIKLNPVETMKAYRKSEREQRHRKDLKLLERNGIVID